MCCITSWLRQTVATEKPYLTANIQQGFLWTDVVTVCRNTTILPVTAILSPVPLNSIIATSTTDKAYPALEIKKIDEVSRFQRIM